MSNNSYEPREYNTARNVKDEHNESSENEIQFKREMFSGNVLLGKFKNGKKRKETDTESLPRGIRTYRKSINGSRKKKQKKKNRK